MKTHVKRILMKRHLRERVEAVIFAYESGLTRAGQGDTGQASTSRGLREEPRRSDRQSHRSGDTKRPRPGRFADHDRSSGGGHTQRPNPFPPSPSSVASTSTCCG